MIGDAAKNQVATNSHNTAFDAKRLITRKFSDAEARTDAKHFPFEVIDKAGKPYIKVQYRGEPKEFVSCDVIRKNFCLLTISFLVP